MSATIMMSVSNWGAASRTGWPLGVVAVLCAAAVAAALLGVTNPLSATQFANTGHWGYNSAHGIVYHVDGATTNIDARMPMDGDAGSQVLQGDRAGYVVHPDGITEFDKASLVPGRSFRPPTAEFALGIQVVGGPYAVYRNAGKIVRLGDPVATISTGGAIGAPVVTDDGTMWFHRTGRGQICRLAKDAVRVSSCPVSAPKDHDGAMTVVDGRPAFVNLFTDRLHTITGDRMDAGIPLGVPLSPGAKPAAQSTGGQLAILDPAKNKLVLVAVEPQPAAPAQPVNLPAGDYDGPIATGEVVVLVDRHNGVVLTVDVHDKKQKTTPIKQKTGAPRLSQGEDERVYVEDAEGKQVLVVGEDGDVRDVDVTGKPTTPTTTPTQTPTQTETETPTQAETQTPTETQPPTSAPPDDRDHRAGPPTESARPVQPPPPVPPGRPGAPLTVTAQAGDGSAVVTWQAAPDNRAPITSYEVTWQTGSLTIGPGALQTPVNGLTNGVTYTFTVTATNQMGAGPGTSSAPVTPVTLAAQPVNLRADYDVAARPARDVTLTWGEPALGGGALAHYEITAPGHETRTVTATEAVYPQVNAFQTIPFTVRAVTRTPDGQTHAGQPAVATHEAAPPQQVILRKGDRTQEYCAGEADCAWMNVVLTGFLPNTDYHVHPYSDRSGGYDNPGHTTKTDGNGHGEINEFAYSGPGETVWVVVTRRPPDGTQVESARLVW